MPAVVVREPYRRFPVYVFVDAVEYTSITLAAAPAYVTCSVPLLAMRFPVVTVREPDGIWRPREVMVSEPPATVKPPARFTKPFDCTCKRGGKGERQQESGRQKGVRR